MVHPRLVDVVRIFDRAQHPGVSSNTRSIWMAEGRIPYGHRPANGYWLSKHQDL